MVNNFSLLILLCNVADGLSNYPVFPGIYLLSLCYVLPGVYPQSVDYTYATPNKKPTVVEPVVYADLSEMEKKSRPSPGKNVDCKVVHSDLLIKGQPPPPLYEPVDLKQVSNLQASVTVIPAGVKVYDSESYIEIVEMQLPHLDNYQEAVEQRSK